MIRGNKAMKKLLAILICAIMCVALLASCEHKHTYGELTGYEEGHCKPYTCGCPYPIVLDDHIDADGNDICDECGYKAVLVYKLNANESGYELDRVGVGYQGGDITIPSEYKGLPVVEIGYGAFKSEYKLTSVIIPDSVTLISDDAFENQTSLTSVNVGKNVVTIGVSAFEGCTSLKTVVIGDATEYIYASAFEGCSALETVTLGKKVKEITGSVFENCTSLKTITIPASIEKMGSWVFNGNNMTDIYFGVSAPGDNWNEKWAEGLNESVNIHWAEKETCLEYKLLGDGTYEVKGIGTCTDTEIVIPSEYQNRKVTSIGYRAFANNSTITGVTIPDSIKSIGEEAFYKCTELTGIVVPDSVTSLGKSAFYECTKLVSLTLGKGIKTISASTFSDCTALASIVIPDGVTTIETNAFNHCEGAKSVTIPKSVTEIASTAFSYTYSVESFIVAEDNTSYIAIDGALFTKDKTKLHQYPLGSTLKSFVLPDECTTITLAAMDSAKYVESITFGKNLATLEIAAIINCTSLKEINVHEENASFKAIDGNLYSKDGKKLVQYALNKDETSFTVPEGVEIIGTCSMKQASNLESITLPSSLKTIESSAFFSCTSLKSLDIPDGITVLDSYIFAGCTALESITIPSSVERIKFLTIAYCENLKTINFEGTQAQWDAIEKDSQWAYEAADYNVICGNE